MKGVSFYSFFFTFAVCVCVFICELMETIVALGQRHRTDRSGQERDRERDGKTDKGR